MKKTSIKTLPNILGGSRICDSWANVAISAVTFAVPFLGSIGIGIALGCALENGTNINWDAQSGINI